MHLEDQQPSSLKEVFTQLRQLPTNLEDRHDYMKHFYDNATHHAQECENKCSGEKSPDKVAEHYQEGVQDKVVIVSANEIISS